jgi:hypothetical protein
VSVFIANTQRGHYSGPILAETDMHVVQQIGAASVVAHFKSALSTVPTVGTECRVAYDNKQGMVTATAARPSAQDAKASARFVGVIHEVTDKAVVQMTGERALRGWCTTRPSSTSSAAEWTRCYRLARPWSSSTERRAWGGYKAPTPKMMRKEA